jgi:hypothetical protein
MAANGISFVSDLLMNAKLSANYTVKKLAWPGTNGLAEASLTLQHHLLHQYGGYSMVWRQLIWFHGCQWDQFFLRLADECKTLSQLQSKNWHGLTPMDKQRPVPHCNITYPTHMEDIQWSGGN